MTFYDDELDDLLKEKLKLLEPTAPRNPESARLRKAVYQKNVKYLQFGKPVFAVVSLFNRKPWQNFMGQRPSLVPFAAVILVIFGLVFGGWGTVYAAQDSLPNDFLYAVKLTGEDLQLFLISDTEARISLLTTYTGRRVEEATRLALLGQPIPEELPDLMNKHLEELFILTASMDEASSKEALKGIQVHLRDQDQVMTNAMNGLPNGIDPQLTQLREMLKERQQFAQMGSGEPDTRQQQLKHQPKKPVTTITDTLTTTITTTLTTPLEITVTRTITPGQYGPGPCELPGACTPAGYTHGPGPFDGIPPVSDDVEGHGPGSDQGPGSQQPSATPKSGKIEQPKQTPKHEEGDSSGEDKDKEGNGNQEESGSQEDSGSKRGK